MYILGGCIGLLFLMNAADAKCPTFFEQYNMACYYYGNNAVHSVQQALESCKSLGGYLLNINADLEYRHTIDRLTHQYNKYDGYWVGGMFKDGYWVWQKVVNAGAVYDVMDPEATHYHWGPNEPGSFFPVLERFAAIMVKGRSKPNHLYSEPGSLRTPKGMSYICEADWTE